MIKRRQTSSLTVLPGSGILAFLLDVNGDSDYFETALAPCSRMRRIAVQQQ
jgi:hypothetical protein